MVCLEISASGDKGRKLNRVKGIGGSPREQDAVAEWRRWHLSTLARKGVNHEDLGAECPCQRGQMSWCTGPSGGVPGSSDEV